MKVGFYQLTPEWKNPRATLSKLKQRLKGETFDLLVLPELFTTGYLLEEKEVNKWAEELDDSRTVEELTKLAQASGGMICGSIIELGDDEMIYNTAVIVSGEGLEGFHRKHHLPDSEQVNFRKSHELPKFIDIKGTPVSSLICFDMWMPELVRILARNGAQIICHPSAFSGPDTLDIVKVRALENKVFIITSNLTGTETGLGTEETYRGSSCIVSPSGKVLLQAGAEESLEYIDIDPAEASHKSLPFCKNLWKEWNRYKTEVVSNAQP
jgi:predicted amidohydrolase